VQSKRLKVVGERELQDGNGVLYPADIIILANGFKTQQLLTPMTIFGVNVVEFRDLWENGRKGTSAYMGEYLGIFISRH